LIFTIEYTIIYNNYTSFFFVIYTVHFIKIQAILILHGGLKPLFYISINNLYFYFCNKWSCIIIIVVIITILYKVVYIVDYIKPIKKTN